MRQTEVYEQAERTAASAVWATFAPLVDSVSLLGTRGAVTGSALGARGDGVLRAMPDEIRDIAATAGDLAEHGQAVTEVAVRIRNGGGEVVGTIDFIWRLVQLPLARR